jgi:hypothetical protein
MVLSAVPVHSEPSPWFSDLIPEITAGKAVKVTIKTKSTDNASFQIYIESGNIGAGVNLWMHRQYRGFI